MRVSVDCDIEEIAKFIALKWLKRSPKIILPIITGLSHFKTWKNQKQLNKFKVIIVFKKLSNINNNNKSMMMCSTKITL